MAPPSLHGIDLKLRRADEHLAFLNLQVGSFMGQGRSMVGEFDADTSEYVYRVTGEPPPVEWGVPMSEWSHLMRSALDNLFVQVLLRRGYVPGERERPSFPLHSDVGSFKHDQGKAWMSALTAEDRTFIEEAQPFKAGEPWKKLEPLTILQELNNADKHRLFHASFVCRFVGVMRYEPEPMQYWVPVGPTLDDFVKASLGKATSFSGIQFPGLFIMPRPIQDIAQAPPVGTFAETTDDRTEIMRIPIVASGPNPQMEVQHSPPPLDISLGDREFPATLATLGAIRQRVHEVVDHFRPLFS